CRYCCDGCPQDLDIPKLISLYNESVNGSGSIQFNINGMKPEELPSACLSCGACAQLCPQEIDIPDIMKKFAEKLAK
ncbi:MAG: 4Fe-4S dicluster domain-containing protein, partial [Oscillospiraceae bacterium]|nr:4Fe-4S dicluster domain-containing protein [Oscillospiraceae bacterium]